MPNAAKLSPESNVGKCLHIITPVKDSIELTLRTVRSVLDSKIGIPFTYTVFNDFSTPENTALLEKAATDMGFALVNLSDVTDTPSPNYRLTLRMALRKALEADASLAIVESDVVVGEEIMQQLLEGASARPDCALAAAITVDEAGEVNYPYESKRGCTGVIEADGHLSFCCTLLTNAFLKKADFDELNAEKQWFDVPISHMALRENFRNYLFCNLRVLHRPHGSRPWKMLKYSNRLKYYLYKFLKGRDKI
ncbi:MAG: glycosyltransferase family 2 protein [Alistipes sp.]|nr:glycosyltransferase family 2 protein [Alistipes sp.]